jgi:Tol biopolymer transport system component
MNSSLITSKRVGLLLFALAPALGSVQPIRANSPSFYAAYWQQGSPQLRLFTPDGKETAASLPARAKLFQVVWFSPDGKAIYGKALQSPRGQSSGITKIEFKPTREGIVRGSEGLEVWHLSVSPSSGKIFIAGWTTNQGTRGECGYFEIDPNAGTVRTLRAEPAVDCRQGPGPMSPDGKYAVSASSKQLGLLDLETGEVRTIKGSSDPGSCSWSPDGRLLACIRDGKIAVVDISTSQVRNIGGSGNGRAEWSPDGRSLLVFRDQLSCLPTLYGASLAVVDVGTGQRNWVKSAHCNITGGAYYGWMSSEAVQ